MAEKVSAALDYLDAVPWNALSAQQKLIAMHLVNQAAIAAQMKDIDRTLELLADLPAKGGGLSGGATRGEPSDSAIGKQASPSPTVVDLRNTLVDLLTKQS